MTPEVESATFDGRLRRAATERDRHARAKAVERLRAAVTLDGLLSAVRILAADADERVRRAAAEVLGADIGDRLAAERLAGIAALPEDEPARIEAIAIELGRMRSLGAVRVLGILAAHGDPEVRHGAARGLASLVALEPGAAAALRYLAGDEDPSVADAAATALRR